MNEVRLPADHFIPSGERSGGVQSIFTRHAAILACPACGGHLRSADPSLTCECCGAQYATTSDGIPLLFVLDGGQTQDVTEIVKAFYEENPFPNYDDLDTDESLKKKARQGIFARLLDEQIPAGALVLEVGCGTGQLTNFLGMEWNRRVFGSDICLNSLRLAKGFRDRCGIKNVGFLQMNLFRPAFQHEVFDLAVCNGVLHHTVDPLRGFKSICQLVKPGGYVVIGLYNKIARFTTDLKRRVFQLTGDRLRFLDSHMRNVNYNEARKRAWFMDQYKHPCESKHSYDEVIEWFESNGFELLLAIPKIDGSPFSPDERLFVRHEKGSKFGRFVAQLETLLIAGADGGLFIMVGRKMGQPQGQAGPKDESALASFLIEKPA
jgi:SAM-dependent methyltransferase